MDTPSKTNTSSTKQRTLFSSTTGLQKHLRSPASPSALHRRQNEGASLRGDICPRSRRPALTRRGCPNEGTWGSFRRRLHPGVALTRTTATEGPERGGLGSTKARVVSKHRRSLLAGGSEAASRPSSPLQEKNKRYLFCLFVRSFVFNLRWEKFKSMPRERCTRFTDRSIFFIIIFYEQCVLNFARAAVFPYPTLRYHRAIFGHIPMYGAAVIWRKLSTPVQLI